MAAGESRPCAHLHPSRLLCGVWILFGCIPFIHTFPGFIHRWQQQQQQQRQQQQLQQQHIQRPSVVDLSHPLGPDTLTWPGFPGLNLTTLVRGRVGPGDGFWLEANWFSISEHGGTHLDAPAHFVQGGEHLDELPPEKFFGEAVLVDGSERAAADADYQLGTEELQVWEREHGRIPDQSVVLVNFGWGRRWPDRRLYFNSPTPEDGRTLRFPGIHPLALQWLVQNRNVKMIGVDVPSVDFGRNLNFTGHRFLCSNRIPFVESMANLDQLPPQGMTVYAVPLSLVGGSGIPVRAYAVISGASRDTVTNLDLSLMFVLTIVVRLVSEWV